MPLQTFAAFTMRGCPHCRAVPELMNSVQDLAPARIVDSEEPLASALGVSSFPTILLVNPLFAFVYRGERTPQALRAWALRKMAQTARFIEDTQQ